MVWLQILLFGDVVMRPADGINFSLRSARTQELFAYLLLHRGKRLSREHLAGTIWHEVDPAHARQYLRKSIWQLQSGLNATGVEEAASLLVAHDSDVTLLDGAGLRVDALSFQDACAAARGVRGRDLQPAVADTLRTAVDLYRGDLLDGWYQNWCLIERERFQVLYIGALDKLVGYCEARGDFEPGIEYCQAVLRQDPAREYTHRALMRLLCQEGDRTGALRQFDRCAAALREELDVEPSPRTVALRDHIRAGHEIPPPDGPPSEGEAGRLLPVLRHLREALEEAQRQVSREIAAISSSHRR